MAERAKPHFAVQFVVRSCMRALVWLIVFSLGINLLILEHFPIIRGHILQRRSSFGTRQA